MMYQPYFPPEKPMAWSEFLRNALVYNWRRWTGQLRQFPEVRGMNYREYKRTYLR